MDVKRGKMRDYRYKLLPVFSNLLEPDTTMAAHIEKARALEDAVAEYLRSEKSVRIKMLNQPKLHNIAGNPRYEAYPAMPSADVRESVRHRAHGSS